MTTTEAVPLRRNRDYMLLMSGQTISVIGSGMTGLALLLLATDLTGSAAQAGIVMAGFGVGRAVFMLPAGAFADRVDRKWLMVTTALASAAVLASIPLADKLFGQLTLTHLIVVATLDGALTTFYSPAERAALKNVVPPEHMGTAMAVTQAREALGGLIGPPLAGLLYGINRALPMIGDALSYLMAALFAAAVRRPLPAPERAERTKLAADIREGLSWVWRTRVVRDIVGSAMFANFAVNGIFAVAVLSLRVDGATGQQLGWLEFSIGAGMLAGSLAAPSVLKLAPVGRLSIGAFCVAVLLIGALPLTDTILGVGALLTAALLLIPSGNSGVSAYMMHITPDRMLGRSGAATSFVSMVMMPLGTGLGGVLLEHLGRTPAMLVYAVFMALSVVMMVGSRPIRQIPRTTDFASIPEAG